MSWSRTVVSDNVESVAYDSESQTLLVKWKKSGKTSAYAGVSEEVADECSRNWSVTDYINAEIKPNYKHLGYVNK